MPTKTKVKIKKKLIKYFCIWKNNTEKFPTFNDNFTFENLLLLDYYCWVFLLLCRMVSSKFIVVLISGLFFYYCYYKFLQCFNNFIFIWNFLFLYIFAFVLRFPKNGNGELQLWWLILQLKANKFHWHSTKFEGNILFILEF